MAAYIQEQMGGELLEIEPLNPYPTDYEECGDVALVERDKNERPEITNLPDSVEEYDTIFIGYPIWWDSTPKVMEFMLLRRINFRLICFPHLLLYFLIMKDPF